MKNKRIFWILITIFVASALLLASCGPQETPTEEAMPEEEMEEEMEEEEMAEEVTLRVFAGNVGQELQLSKDAAARYMEENPNVTVEVVDTPDFVEDRLGVYLQLFEAQSSEGDVFQIDVIWPGDLAEHFVDLYEYGADEVAGDHFPAIVENNTVDGKLVGIPWFTDAGLLYYRADLLEKYGYDGPPETWDELEEMAQTIQDGEREDGNQDFWGFVWQGNAYEGLTCDALEWVHSNGGGTIVSPDKVITVNNEAAIAAVEQAAGWVDTISPPGVTGFGEEDARGVWQAGNAAFMRNWPYAYSLGQADDSPIKDKFDVSPLPAGDAGHGSATLGGWQLAVSKYSEHPDVAADLALFMASYDEQKTRAIEGSLNPTIMSLYEDEDVLEATPFFGSLYDVFVNAVARPSTATAPQYAETSRIFFNGVHSVLTGETDAVTAFEEMEADLVDLLGYETGEPMAMPAMEEEAMEEEETMEATETFKLGIMGPFSGPSAQTGKQFKGGATIALEEYDYQIGPYQIEPVWIDSQSDPAKASQAYEQAVVQDEIQAGALNWHSSVAVAVMEVTAKHQIPHIFGFGATEKVNETFESDPEKYGYWSTKGWPTPGKLGNKYVDALEYYIEQGVWAPEEKTVAIYGEDTDWGRSFGADAITLFEEAGWEVVSEEYFPLEQTEFYPFLNKLKDLNPAVIAGTSTAPPSITAFIKQADEVGLESLIIADGLGWVDFCSLTGDSADGVIDQIAGWSGDEGFAFAEEFEERYDLAPSTSSAGLAHDGVKMFMEIAQMVYDENGELTSELIQQFVEENVWTGEWSMTDGLVMVEYKYTEETIPDPVVGPGFYTFPVLQYSFENGKCLGKPIFPVEGAVQDLQAP